MRNFDNRKHSVPNTYSTIPSYGAGGGIKKIVAPIPTPAFYFRDDLSYCGKRFVLKSAGKKYKTLKQS